MSKKMEPCNAIYVPCRHLKAYLNLKLPLPFTKWRALGNLESPSFFGIQLHENREMTYQVLILDAKITWNSHTQEIITKGKAAIKVSKRATGKTWVNLCIVNWLYITALIVTVIIYCSLVWWPNTDQRKTGLELSKRQRQVCLYITRAIQYILTAAMETLLILSHLSTFIPVTEMMGVYGMK